jgi:hypothetical protein
LIYVHFHFFLQQINLFTIFSILISSSLKVPNPNINRIISISVSFPLVNYFHLTIKIIYLFKQHSLYNNYINCYIHLIFIVTFLFLSNLIYFSPFYSLCSHFSFGPSYD